MWIDVEQLYGFYASPRGRMVTRVVMEHLRHMWGDVHGQTLVAFGYGVPFLSDFSFEAERALCLMPAPLGVCPWPVEGPNATCLCPVDRIALPDNSVHKLLLIHALEFAPDPHALLKEAWRVLVAGGELIICAPNRRGFWARSPHNPFGDGTPYAGRQLYSLAQEACFSPDKPVYCLFYPPTVPLLSPKAHETLERFGNACIKKVGGLVMLRSYKKMIAKIETKTPSLGRRIFLPEGLVPQAGPLGQVATEGYATSGSNSKTPGKSV
ncbi:MAG: methyltransferase type 11 [Candidatus Puniceispirillum sp.]|nr:methyltransferase type 11 [Candidatus Puniceispirillum sp.]